MPFPTSVYLESDCSPVFPARCCRCLAADPDGSVKVAHRRSTWLSLFVPWLWFVGRKAVYRVPVCSGCRGRVVWHRRALLAVAIAVLIAAVMITFPWLTSLELPRGWRRLVQVGVVVTALFPCGLVWVLMPPAVDLTVRKDMNELEFANADYARLFVEANPDAIAE